MIIKSAGEPKGDSPADLVTANLYARAASERSRLRKKCF